MAMKTMLAGTSNKKKPTAKSDEEILQGLSAKDKQLNFDLGEPTAKAPGRPAKHPRKGQDFTHMNIFIPKDLHKRFTMHAVEIEASMNDLMIDAITAYMGKVKK